MAQLSGRRLAALAGLSVVVTACQSLSAVEERPAIIAQPTAESRAELQRVIDSATNTHVLLANDALTGSSVLTIGLRGRESIAGQPAHGRNMETPIQFRLLKKGRRCTLVDQRDASRYVLTATTCSYEE